MAKTTEKLDARTVATRTVPGYYGDGGGLWLQVSKRGTKSWVFRFTLNGRSREMGLGSVNTFTLAEARKRAREARQLVADGIDPIEEKRARKAAEALAAARAKTFDDCASAYIEAHRAGWRNSKHIDQWTNTLDMYASPAFGSLPVADVDTTLVMRAIEPIWTTKPETASRVRGRIESVLDWAKVRGYRKGENPARWRGHLENLLPKRKRVAAVKHHPALPYREIGEFMKELRKQEGVAARALEFTILTAARTGEAIKAQWDEFDLDAGLWTVPAERMKTRKEHRVPLSADALSVLKTMKKIAIGEYVFYGARKKQGLSDMAMLAVLSRMGRDDLTVHGFRSTFRDWAAEMTAYPREVAEMALAHSVGDKVEAAYRRGDLFAKRVRLMEDWAKFCDVAQPRGEVVPMKGERHGTR